MADQNEQSCKLHPQTMCPAFGALRVLTRIEGAHPAMITDTGCLYGLTFVTHFYGARKSLIAPQLGTKELTSGTMMEGTYAAINKAAEEPGCRLVPVISLCVAETQGMSEELLPKKVGNADVVLVRVPAYAIHSHPEAKDVAVSALLRRYAADVNPDEGEEKTLLLLGEIFPADPIAIDALLRKMGASVGVALPSRSIDDFIRAGECGAVAALHPFYRGSVGFLRERGMPVVGGAPIGRDATTAWIKSVGSALKLDPALVARAVEEERATSDAVLRAQPLSGTIMVTGYEGNELGYAKLLVEAGANVPYVSTSIGQGVLTAGDEAWLKAHGTKRVVYRKSLEEDVAALDEFGADLVIGTTPFAAIAKERGIPGVYFTNMLSVRPFFLSGGMAATIGLIKGLLDRTPRYKFMEEFFTVLPNRPQPATVS